MPYTRANKTCQGKLGRGFIKATHSFPLGVIGTDFRSLINQVLEVSHTSTSLNIVTSRTAKHTCCIFLDMSIIVHHLGIYCVNNTTDNTKEVH